MQDFFYQQYLFLGKIVLLLNKSVPPARWSESAALSWTTEALALEKSWEYDKLFCCEFHKPEPKLRYYICIYIYIIYRYVYNIKYNF